MKAGGGIITAADLASYQPVWRDPLRFAYRGHSIVSMPPPSSGGIVLAMTAGMLGKVELGKLPWHGAEHVHWLTEVWRRAFAARNELLGDPAFVKEMPIAKLTSQDVRGQARRDDHRSGDAIEGGRGAARRQPHDEPVRRRCGGHGGRDDHHAQHVVGQRRHRQRLPPQQRDG